MSKVSELPLHENPDGSEMVPVVADNTLKRTAVGAVVTAALGTAVEDATLVAEQEADRAEAARAETETLRAATLAIVQGNGVFGWYASKQDAIDDIPNIADQTTIGVENDETRSSSIVMYLKTQGMLVLLQDFGINPGEVHFHLRCLFEKLKRFHFAGIPEGRNQIGVDENAPIGPQVSLTASGRIAVTSSAELAALPGVTGTGLPNDPFKLSGLSIIGSGSMSAINAGVDIAITGEATFFEMEDCEVSGWSSGNIRVVTEPGSVITLRRFRMDLDENSAHVSANRRDGIVNNVGEFDPGGTVFRLIGCEMRAMNAQNGMLGYAQGDNCGLIFRDLRIYGGFWFSAFETVASSPMDRGDRYIRGKRLSIVDGRGDGANNAYFMIGAPGVIADIGDGEVVSWQAGADYCPIIQSGAHPDIDFPVRRAPRVYFDYLYCGEHDGSLVDLHFFEPMHGRHAPIGRFCEGTSVDPTTRLFQLGGANGAGADPDLYPLGGELFASISYLKIPAGGAKTEAYMMEEGGDFFFRECVSINLGTDGSTDDGEEFYGGQKKHGSINGLSLGFGQAFDSFTNGTSRPFSGQAICIGMLGHVDDEAVQLTNVGSALVYDLGCGTGRPSDQIQTTQGGIGIADADKAAVIAYNRFAGMKCGPVRVFGYTPPPGAMGFIDNTLTVRAKILSHVSIDGGEPVDGVTAGGLWMHGGKLVFTGLDTVETKLVGD